MNIEHKTFEWLSLIFNVETGFVNITKLSKLYQDRTGKRRDVSQWLNDKGGKSKERFKHYSKILGIPEEELIDINRGGEPDAQGTFVHYRLAISFAIWLSPEFEAAVTEIIEQKIRELQRDEIAEELDEISREINSLEVIQQQSKSFAKEAHTKVHRSIERKKAASEKLNSIKKRVDRVKELRKAKPKLRPKLKRIPKGEE